MAMPLDAWDGAAARGTATASARTPPPPRSSPRPAAGRQAYQHLRAAVRLLHGQQPAAELDRLRREHAEAREQSRRDSLTASYNRRYLDERLVTLLADPASRGTRRDRHRAGRRRPLQAGQRHLRPPVRGPGAAAASSPSWTAGCPTARSAPATAARSSPSCCPAATWPRRCGSARPPASGSTATRGTSWRPSLRVTVSVGVAHSCDPLADVERLVGAADTLLYAAKHSGRNAVAYRDEQTGLVRLAGAAGGAARRQADGSACRDPRCDRCGPLRKLGADRGAGRDDHPSPPARTGSRGGGVEGGSDRTRRTDPADTRGAGPGRGPPGPTRPAPVTGRARRSGSAADERELAATRRSARSDAEAVSPSSAGTYDPCTRDDRPGRATGAGPGDDRPRPPPAADGGIGRVASARGSATGPAAPRAGSGGCAAEPTGPSGRRPTTARNGHRPQRHDPARPKHAPTSRRLRRGRAACQHGRRARSPPPAAPRPRSRPASRSRSPLGSGAAAQPGRTSGRNGRPHAPPRREPRPSARQHPTQRRRPVADAPTARPGPQPVPEPNVPPGARAHAPPSPAVPAPTPPPPPDVGPPGPGPDCRTQHRGAGGSPDRRWLPGAGRPARPRRVRRDRAGWAGKTWLNSAIPAVAALDPSSDPIVDARRAARAPRTC